KPKMNLAYLQSGRVTGQRKAYSGWEIANAMHKISGWVTTDELNYFALYPEVGKHWMDRLPMEVYTQCTSWIRKQRGKNKEPKTPGTKDIERIKAKERAVPHPSLKNVSNLPPSYPLNPSPSSSSLSSPPSDLSSVASEKAIISQEEMYAAMTTVNTYEANAIKVF